MEAQPLEDVFTSFSQGFKKKYQGKGKCHLDTFPVAAVVLSSEGAGRLIEEALNQLWRCSQAGSVSEETWPEGQRQLRRKTNNG